MEILSNRELAFVSWFLVITIYISFSSKTKKIRKSIVKLIKYFFSKKIFIINIIMIMYIILIIYGLYYIGIWKIHQLKNTIIWAFSVGVLSLFKINSIKNDPKFFYNLVLDNLKLIVFIQFILVFNTFSFLVELLLFPIYIVIGGMLAVTKNKQQFYLIEKILNWIIILIGTITIIYSIFMLVTNFGEFANEKTLYDFIIPPILSFFYIPFIFMMMIIFSYEIVFLRIKNYIKNPKVRKFAKLHSMLKFHFRLKTLERWVYFMQLRDVISKENIRETINQILHMVETEKNPPQIQISEGWSPYTAKCYLLDEGLATGYYQPYVQEEWSASSSLIQIDDSVLSNCISYHIEGNSHSVKILKIILDVYYGKTSLEAYKVLAKCANALLKSALNMELSHDLKQSILDGSNKEVPLKDHKVGIIKNIWNSANVEKYSIQFVITKT